MRFSSASLAKLTCALLGLSACVSTPAKFVPEDYRGPLAYIKDSVTWDSETGNFFCLSKLDGRSIRNTFGDATTTGSNGLVYSIVLGRDVPARSAVFLIEGRRYYRRPIDRLSQNVREISGEVTFAPEPQHDYEVVGELGKDYSAIWIEDAATHRAVTKKVEIRS